MNIGQYNPYRSRCCSLLMIMNLSNSRDPCRFVMDPRPATLLNILRKEDDDETLKFDIVTLMGKNMGLQSVILV